MTHTSHTREEHVLTVVSDKKYYSRKQVSTDEEPVKVSTKTSSSNPESINLMTADMLTVS